jgi:hypothetical protein
LIVELFLWILFRKDYSWLRPPLVHFEGPISCDYGEYTNSLVSLQYYFELQRGPKVATMYPGLGPDLTDRPYFLVERPDGEAGKPADAIQLTELKNRTDGQQTGVSFTLCSSPAGAKHESSPLCR